MIVYTHLILNIHSILILIFAQWPGPRVSTQTSPLLAGGVSVLTWSLSVLVSQFGFILEEAHDGLETLI